MNATLDSTEMDTDTSAAVNIDRSAGDFSYPENHTYDAGYGLSEATIDYICDVKNDPDWVRDFRKRALKVFQEKPLTMEWCLECHRNPAPFLRNPENVTKMGYVAAPGEGEDIRKKNGVNPPTNCSTCHR